MPTPRSMVVDTNLVLDLLVFLDPGALALAAACGSPQWVWVGTTPMRDELARVLHYPAIAQRVAQAGLVAAQVLQRYDAQVSPRDAAPRCKALCSDRDDQMFIDLAVEHGALLLSKDRKILKMRSRLASLGVHAMTAAQFAG